jgi:hypothetical protein
VIAVGLLPGAYADKWPGSYPIQFFVAADGGVDSMRMSIKEDLYRQTVQEVFREYRFSPARLRGCPVPSSIEIRVGTASGLPKPSAYEGFPPTPEELARDTRGPRNPTSPAEPYIVRGSCPFECCRYGEWQARETTPVYATEGKVGRPVFTLRPGDSVRAVTGNVHVTKLGRIKIVGKVRPGWAEFDNHKLPVPAIGDTVYLLSYVGEGYWDYWYRGLLGTGEELSQQSDGTVPAQLLAKPETEWWVQVIDRRGRTGWVTEGGFAGADGCG